MQVSIIGLDIAKNVFHAVAIDTKGREVWKKRVRRAQVLRLFAQQPPCLVAMEGCSGAHHWGREFENLGHRSRVLSPHVVKSYVHGAKNDFNDARAIAEAAARANVRSVPLKARWQHELQALHRLRQAAVRERTALANRLRGLLGEFGLVAPQGIAHLRRRLPEFLEDADNDLTPYLREALERQRLHLHRLDEEIATLDRRIHALARDHDDARRLTEVPGIGPLGATALCASFASATQFRKGRDLAAALGLVPRQHSTGGRTVLLGITKRGDRYLRTLLIHGARSVLSHAARRDDPLSRWALALQARRGTNVATVALANKLARIAWVVLARGESYRAERHAPRPAAA